MMREPLTRRKVIASALALGASYAFPGPVEASRVTRHEAPQRFPEGVASGDPDSSSVLLWTRREPKDGENTALVTVEISLDSNFLTLISRSSVTLTAASDWTCRILAGGLRSGTTYWYRFTDLNGEGSRVGRTRTSPCIDDAGKARFAFVSCQNINMGPLNAWRRMIYDDERAITSERIDFVLHLGDFIYDTVWLPEDRPQGYFDRTLRHIVDFPVGEKIEDFHIPVIVEDYRALYRAYLRDPDLQEARARWPFVAIWDNGEFSDKGWQGMERFSGKTRPAQMRKVAANQAWFEYMPARVRTTDGSLATFAKPAVKDVPVRSFDQSGLGQEENNLRAIASLTGYRTFRWGRHMELILTDQRSYRSEDYTAAPESKAMDSKNFPQMVPFESLQMIDAGKTWNGGRPPSTLTFADATVPNFRSSDSPRTLLGAQQKAWFLDRLAKSTATWKVWGNTVATFDMRADPQNLPKEMTVPWPGKGYAGYARTDHSTTFAERAEIYDFVRDRRITGFATVSGDRHSFWAGFAAKSLPPEPFEPVGINFVVGSISSPGMAEAFEYTLAKTHPLRLLYLIDRPGASKPEPAMNLLLHHGVETCRSYASDGNLASALARRNPDNAPHVRFVDMAGHGYALVNAGERSFNVDFICIPRPLHPSGEPNGGPIRYRVQHSTHVWKAGETPTMLSTLLDGDASLSL